MTLRIFYFLIALFSISVVFGLFNNSFMIDVASSDLKVANLRAQNTKIYELNITQNYALYEAKGVTRYNDYDEIEQFNGSMKNENLHNLSSDFAIIKDKNITMKGHAFYQNFDENLSYNSEELFYADDILSTNVPFTLLQNGKKVVANSGNYNIKTKIMKAKNIKGEFEK